jgi:pimeloyl-ACP methyl ester carboxylesterase
MKRIAFVVVIVCFAAYFTAPLFFDRNQLPAGPEQWHCRFRDVPGDPKLTTRPTASLKIIRVTNLGEFVDRCELTDVLYELNWGRADQAGRAHARFDPQAPKLPKLAVLYIHGWKHDASENDQNLVEFKLLIDRLRERHKTEKYVVGIYVGWNATADLPEPFESFSFWVKKSDADRISQGGAVTKIVSSIGAVIAQNGHDQFIAIGHSFGARMLYSATAQSLVAQTEFAHPGYNGGEYEIFRGTADAIILVNPAFEASRYTVLDDFTRSGEKFASGQKPLLVSISSDQDWATRVAFPIGQWFDLANTARERTTLGNYTPYRSHRLEISTGVSCNPIGPAGMSESFDKAGLCLRRVKREEIEKLSPDERNKVRSTYQPFNPFIVATTPGEVISGHGDIWNPKFTGWMFELIAALEDRPPTTTPSQ